MEKIKVNMSPNPLDVQTIHASQNDGEARQWEFELHNNGELIDTSEITEQLFFKAYKGGTEQILPENTSTPTTSPFKGDIRYPQGLLTDQEFLYRQSPTESDGLAKITDIKGNTLVWNQLVPNDVINVTRTTAIDWSTFTSSSFNFSLLQGHKYLFILKGQTVNGGQIGLRDSTAGIVFRPNTGYAILYTANASTYNTTYLQGSWSGGTTNAYLNMFDLTQMGLDITDPSDFTSLFSLPYYSYNQGSLLSFNGNGIKTVGKNLFNQEWESGSIDNTTGEPIANAYIDRFKEYIRVFPSTRYYYWYENIGNNMPIYYYDGNKNYLGRIIAYSDNAFETPSNCYFIRGAIANGQGLPQTLIQKDGTEREYEPYTTSTLSLPISTYFPTGMKSAGTVYDELTENKAITRIGSVDLGTLSWSWQSTWQAWYTYQISVSLKGASNNDTKPNIVSANYPTLALNSILGTSAFGISISNVSSGNKLIAVENGSDTVTPTGYLYYELATPTESSFTTASLVTENAEIPLSNEDGVLIGKCTEQLSENPGFIDAKIKLADADGECYSNKIQLHVERSPQ